MNENYYEDLTGFTASGERGRRIAKGFTLKSTNPKSPAYYVYVWGEFNKEKSNKTRKLTGTKGYSHSSNWQSLGRKGDAQTMEKLKAHLATKYGEVEKNLEFVMSWLDRKHEDMEKQRIIREKKKITQLWEIIRSYREKKNEKIEQPKTFEDALELVMDLMKEEINLYKEKFNLDDSLPLTFSLRTKLLIKYHDELGEVY